jgi:hypothetical protein
MTSELAGRNAMIQICPVEGILSLNIEDGIRFNKAITGQQLSAEKRF